MNYCKKVSWWDGILNFMSIAEISKQGKNFNNVSQSQLGVAVGKRTETERRSV